MAQAIKNYERDLKKLKDEIRKLKQRAASNARKKSKKASHSKKSSRVQSSKSKKEIEKHKTELRRIREKVSNLEKRKKRAVLRPTLNFKNSINKLNSNVDSLLKLFNQTHEELEKGTLQPEKQIIEKLDMLLGQNEKIAQGILTVASMIKQGQPDQQSPGGLGQETAQPGSQDIDNMFDEQATQAPQQSIQNGGPESYGTDQGAMTDMSSIQSSGSPVDITAQENGPAGFSSMPEEHGQPLAVNQNMPGDSNTFNDPVMQPQEQGMSQGVQPFQTQSDQPQPDDDGLFEKNPDQQSNMPSSFYAQPKDDTIKTVEPTEFPTRTGEPLFQTPFQPSSPGQDTPSMQPMPRFSDENLNNPPQTPPQSPPPMPDDFSFQSPQPPRQAMRPPAQDNVRPIQQNTAPIPPFGSDPKNRGGRLQLRPFDNGQK